MGILDTVKNLLSKNADKVDTAIDKVGDVVDKKTQGKYAGHVDKVQTAAKKAVDSTAPASEAQPTPPQAAPTPPQAQPTPAPQQPPAAPPTS